jgi:hypothetical protein
MKNRSIEVSPMVGVLDQDHYEIRKAPAPSRLTASMFTNEYAMQTAIDNYIKAEEAKKKNV